MDRDNIFVSSLKLVKLESCFVSFKIPTNLPAAMFGLQVILVLVIGLNGVPSKRPPLCKCLNFKMPDEEWNSYKTAQKKVYPSCFDECRRRFLWEKNFNYTKYFKYHGKFMRTAKGEPTFRVAPNKFSDMTETERRKSFGLIVPSILKSQEPFPTTNQTSNVTDYTTSINYVEKGYVTPVKDQGYCSSCWAFTAAAAMEAQYFKATGVLREFSTQWLIDCCNNSTLYSCYGCDGGWMNGAFQCAKDMGGVCKMDSYNSYQEKTETCVNGNNSLTKDFQISGYVAVPMGDEKTMSEYLYKAGPLACAIDADPSSMVYYSNGIYSDTTCSTSVNHAITVVGQGIDKVTGLSYWLCKNSWGISWGENGYLRLLRGANQCGVAQCCTYPTYRYSAQ